MPDCRVRLPLFPPAGGLAARLPVRVTKVLENPQDLSRRQLDRLASDAREEEEETQRALAL